MTDSVFDVALEKRFSDSTEMTTIDVTSGDMLLIRDSATGIVMRMSFATLTAAISSAFSSSFASLIDGKVPSSQLPSYVDDVLEYANLAAFPAIGESGKIYVAIDTNKTYRWSGLTYIYITSGAVDSVAGKTGVVTLNKSDVGLSNVDNTSDSTKNSATATLENKTLTNPVIALIKSNTANTPTQFTDSSGNEVGTLCRAWVKFNGATGAISSSFNVSSVTRVSAGIYQINFSAAFADTNYAVVAMANQHGGVTLATMASGNPASAAYAEVYTCDSTGALFDPNPVSVLVFK